MLRSTLVSPRVTLFLVAATLLGMSAALQADPFPVPSPYPISWQLKFDHGTPKRIIVDVPGTSHPLAYWYLTYTVTNAGDKVQTFVPRFDLLDDQGGVTHADLAIAPEVFNAIKHREGNRLLVRAQDVEGPLAPGEDEAKDSVAIWPEPVRRMGVFHIFVGGLSGEFIEMKGKDGKPIMTKDPTTGQPTRVILHKTLELTYHILGQEVRPGQSEDDQTVEQWVMR